jgi:hypothetical protein
MRFDRSNSIEQTYGSLSNFPRFNESWEVGSHSVNEFVYFWVLFISSS